MDQPVFITTAWDQRHALIARLRDVLPSIAASAASRDETAAFPAEELALLHAAGALMAPLPGRLDGLGCGTEPAAAGTTLLLLRLVGAASLPLGRVYEGHMNAIRLVCRLGSAKQAEQAARDAAAGHLFGVWNTDPAQHGLTLDAVSLHGAKILCSGAGSVTRALVTTGQPRRLLLVRLDRNTRTDLTAWTAQGMRASATGRVEFGGISLRDVQEIGPPDGYLAQPDFSGGAWRASAVALGGLDAIIDQLRGGLVARARDVDPHQRARVGAALIAQETAALWLGKAATLAEAGEADADDVVAYVGLARIAVETACLDAMRLAQRSLGLGAFMRPAPIERICRDLATYLRQPAPDETLTEAAAHFMRRPIPALREYVA